MSDNTCNNFLSHQESQRDSQKFCSSFDVLLRRAVHLRGAEWTYSFVILTSSNRRSHSSREMVVLDG